MATLNKTTPKTASKTKSSEWYTSTGWKVFNELLCELEQEPLNKVWVENFEIVSNSLKNISKKELVTLFNQDSINWRLGIDGSGTLYATRN